MKTKKLILVSALALVAFSMCKKDAKTGEQPANPATAGSNTTQAVTQKQINISSEQTLAMIRKLKSLSKNNNAQARLSSSDSLDTDSALYLIEAALNFDFDYDHPNNYDFAEDASDATAGITIVGTKISEQDLEDAYSELHDYLSSKVTTSQNVRAVDIEAYISSSGEITFQAFSLLNILGVGNPCNVVATQTFCRWTFAYNNTFGCSDPYPDASAAVIKRINCEDFGGCSYSYYWTNLGAGAPPNSFGYVSFNTNGTDATLSSGYVNQSTICNPGLSNSDMTGTQVNAAINKCYSITNNFVSTTWGTTSMYDAYYRYIVGSLGYTGTQVNVFYTLKAKFGQRVCRSWPMD